MREPDFHQPALTVEMLTEAADPPLALVNEQEGSVTVKGEEAAELEGLGLSSGSDRGEEWQPVLTVGAGPPAAVPARKEISRETGKTLVTWIEALRTWLSVCLIPIHNGCQLA